ncbi:uncharacterized protein BJ171DRAFT_504131 [Polychytrium aggregatum]|uniref:uncharacterized protein n=1 Tax=Polychytrium aggregatum TaxID=110093 RepID=UPI0022FE1E12|nr:uncharacterized protein BJ171DRAFT_504131 [Polychytrium aggregatum]KAI9204939.1 hypothetical protein BJ171DRAFT_504131 [Polychytrium aggregatum]
MGAVVSRILFPCCFRSEFRIIPLSESEESQFQHGEDSKDSVPTSAWEERTAVISPPRKRQPRQSRQKRVSVPRVIPPRRILEKILPTDSEGPHSETSLEVGSCESKLPDHGDEQQSAAAATTAASTATPASPSIPTAAATNTAAASAIRNRPPPGPDHVPSHPLSKLESLPSAVLVRILQFLPAFSLLTATHISKTVRAQIEATDRELWLPHISKALPLLPNLNPKWITTPDESMKKLFFLHWRWSRPMTFAKKCLVVQTFEQIRHCLPDRRQSLLYDLQRQRRLRGDSESDTLLAGEPKKPTAVKLLSQSIIKAVDTYQPPMSFSPQARMCDNSILIKIGMRIYFLDPNKISGGLKPIHIEDWASKGASLLSFEHPNAPTHVMRSRSSALEGTEYFFDFHARSSWLPIIQVEPAKTLLFSDPTKPVIQLDYPPSAVPTASFLAWPYYATYTTTTENEPSKVNLYILSEPSPTVGNSIILQDHGKPIQDHSKHIASQSHSTSVTLQLATATGSPSPMLIGSFADVPPDVLGQPVALTPQFLAYQAHVSPFSFLSERETMDDIASSIVVRAITDDFPSIGTLYIPTTSPLHLWLTRTHLLIGSREFITAIHLGSLKASWSLDLDEIFGVDDRRDVSSLSVTDDDEAILLCLADGRLFVYDLWNHTSVLFQSKEFSERENPPSPGSSEDTDPDTATEGFWVVWRDTWLLQNKHIVTRIEAAWKTVAIPP